MRDTPARRKGKGAETRIRSVRADFEARQLPLGQVPVRLQFQRAAEIVISAFHIIQFFPGQRPVVVGSVQVLGTECDGLVEGLEGFIVALEENQGCPLIQIGFAGIRADPLGCGVVRQGLFIEARAHLQDAAIREGGGAIAGFHGFQFNGARADFGAFPGRNGLELRGFIAVFGDPAAEDENLRICRTGGQAEKEGCGTYRVFHGF